MLQKFTASSIHNSGPHVYLSRVVEQKSSYPGNNFTYKAVTRMITGMLLSHSRSNVSDQVSIRQLRRKLSLHPPDARALRAAVRRSQKCEGFSNSGQSSATFFHLFIYSLSEMRSFSSDRRGGLDLSLTLCIPNNQIACYDWQTEVSSRILLPRLQVAV